MTSLVHTHSLPCVAHPLNSATLEIVSAKSINLILNLPRLLRHGEVSQCLFLLRSSASVSSEHDERCDDTDQDTEDPVDHVFLPHPRMAATAATVDATIGAASAAALYRLIG